MKMKLLVVLSALVAIALAAPPRAKDDTPYLLNFTNNNPGTGPYSFSYQTSDGVGREESGGPLDPKDPNSPFIIKGSYSFTSPDGTPYVYEYVADENGYRVNRVK